MEGFASQHSDAMDAGARAAETFRRDLETRSAGVEAQRGEGQKVGFDSRWHDANSRHWAMSRPACASNSASTASALRPMQSSTSGAWISSVRVSAVLRLNVSYDNPAPLTLSVNRLDTPRNVPKGGSQDHFTGGG